MLSSRTTMRLRLKSAALAVCLSLTAAVGGCGGIDGIELQGGVFDALGVSGSGSQKKLSEVKVEPRQTLVLPPTTDKLPPPETGSLAAAPPDASWPVDPEDRKAANRAELEKRHKAFCEREVSLARARNESGVIMGPMGNCQPGLLGSLKKQLGGE